MCQSQRVGAATEKALILNDSRDKKYAKTRSSNFDKYSSRSKQRKRDGKHVIM